MERRICDAHGQGIRQRGPARMVSRTPDGPRHSGRDGHDQRRRIHQNDTQLYGASPLTCQFTARDGQQVPKGHESLGTLPRPIAVAADTPH